MTREQAKRILDEVRSGEADYAPAFITMALFASGDLQPIERKPAAVADADPSGRTARWAEGRRRWHRLAERAAA